ncbi:MAG: polysaccharide biosynthesis C-terminal domain-containing protein [Oceanicaulis sp.]
MHIPFLSDAQSARRLHAALLAPSGRLMLNRHLIAYLPVYAAQGLVGFGAVIVFTRILSPEEYGRYTLLLAAASLFGTLAFTWLDAAVARHHQRAAARGRLSGHLFTAWRIYALLAAPILVLAGAGLWLLPMGDALKTACAFALAHTVIRSGVTLALETRRAAGEAWRYSILESLTTSAAFALGVVFVLAGGMGAAGPFAGLALAGGVALLVDAPILLSKARRDRADGARGAAFLAYGAPVALSLIFEGLLTTGDRFLIAAFLGEAATGAYAAGYALSDRTLSIVFLWLGTTTGPLLIRALETEGREAARAVARRTAGLMALLGLPAAVGLALIAEPAARLLVDDALADAAALVMPFIALSGLMNGVMTFYFHEAYVLGRKPRLMAAIMAGAAVLNLALNLALIPAFGLIGAALSTVIAYALALIVCAVHGRRIFALPVPWPDWARALAATAAMALAVLLAPGFDAALWTLGAKIGAGALAYAAVALLLNVAGCRAMLAALPGFKLREVSP